MSTSKIGDMIGTESSRPVVSSGSDRGTSSGLWVRGEAARRPRQTINTSNAVPDDEPRVSLRTKPEATPCCCGVSSSDMILGKARAMSAMGNGLKWSAQHSNLVAKMECGHETATSHLLLGCPAIRDLGSLAGP